MAESLPSKIKECLRDNITDKEMNKIKSLLRDEPETRYGRNIIEEIGNSPYELYNQMSRRGQIKDDDYSCLIKILDKAKLCDVTGRIKEIIEEHKRSAARPNKLAVHNPSPLHKHPSGRDAARSQSRNPDSVNDVSSDFPKARLPDLPDVLDRNTHYLNSIDRMYPIDQNRRGLVAIINNFTTKRAGNFRAGTIEDQLQIESLFTSPSFNSLYEVDSRKDLCKQAFLGALDEWKQKLMDFDSQYNSFLLFILSHGKKEGIEAYYPESTPPGDHIIPIDDITDIFKGCLQDRPKAIFIQACQGADEIVEADCSGSSDRVDDIIESDYPQLRPPRHADMLTAMATVKGFKAYRSINKENPEQCGSWFIHHLIDEIERAYSHRYTGHLLDILTEVQLIVSTRRGVSSPDSVQTPNVYVRQMPCFQSTLRKKFYLLPPRMPYE